MRESAYGVIPVRFVGGHPELFVVCHNTGGWWGFPKGHTEEGETPHETARRELKEESGLCIVRWLEAPPFEEAYTFVREGCTIHKEVTYYLAEVAGDIALQSAEVLEGRWVDIGNVHDLLTYPESRATCRMASEFLSKHNGIAERL